MCLIKGGLEIAYFLNDTREVALLQLAAPKPSSKTSLGWCLSTRCPWTFCGVRDVRY